MVPIFTYTYIYAICTQKNDPDSGWIAVSLIQEIFVRKDQVKHIGNCAEMIGCVVEWTPSWMREKYGRTNHDLSSFSPSRMASLGVRVRANPTIQKMESPPMDPQLVGHEHAHAYVSSALIDCLFACADQGGSLITIWYFWYVFSNFKSKRNDGNRRTTGSSYHHPLRVQLFACGSWWSRPHLPPAPGRVRMATRQCQDCAGRNLQWQFPPEN